jgi:hypothetical protein
VHGGPSMPCKRAQSGPCSRRHRDAARDAVAPGRPAAERHVNHP